MYRAVRVLLVLRQLWHMGDVRSEVELARWRRMGMETGQKRGSEGGSGLAGWFVARPWAEVVSGRGAALPMF